MSKEAFSGMTKRTTRNWSLFEGLPINLLMDRHKFLAPSRSIGHLYILSWLLEKVSPRLAVTFGVSHGTGHFAICQTMRDYELDGRCVGILLETPVEPSTLQANNRVYSHFSELYEGTKKRVSEIFSDGAIDFLLLNSAPSRSDPVQDFGSWETKFSDTGVMIIPSVSDFESAGDHAHSLKELTLRFENIRLGYQGGVLILFIGKKSTSGFDTGSDFAPLDAKLREFEPALSVLERCNHLKMSLAMANADKDNFNQEISKQRAEIAELQNGLSAVNSAYDARHRKAAALESECFNRRNFLAELEAERDHLKSDLATRFDEIAILTARLESPPEDGRFEDKRIAELSARLKGVKAKKDRRIADLLKKLERVEAKNRRIDELSKNIEILEAERKRLDAKVEALLNSNSWKLTRPLRSVMRTIKKR